MGVKFLLATFLLIYIYQVEEFETVRMPIKSYTQKKKKFYGKHGIYDWIN